MHLGVLLPLFTAFAQAASFTSSFEDKPSKEENVDVTDFPFYWGDEKILSIIINMSGTVARSFPRNAMYLDHLLTDEHIRAMIIALSDFDGKQLNMLGFLLRELPPQRFDSIMSTFYDPLHNLKDFIDGYPNQESLWKKSRHMDCSLSDYEKYIEQLYYEMEDVSVDYARFLTVENAAFFPRFSPKLCDLMRDRPAEILNRNIRAACARHWIQAGESYIARKMLWELKNLENQETEIVMAFDGHGDEFVAWYKARMIDGSLQKVHHISLPVNYLHSEHLKDLKEFIAQGNFRSFPLFTATLFNFVFGVTFDEQPEVTEYNQLNKEPYLPNLGSSSGFDSERYSGELVIARAVFDNDLNKITKGYPMELNEACGEAIAYGVYEPLENTISLLYSVDDNPRRTITQVFWTWYYCFDVDFEINLERMKRIMSIIKPHLTELILPYECDADEPNCFDNDSDTRWHFLPLYEDMQKNMDDYWPEGLKHRELDFDIEDWVNVRGERIPTSEAYAVRKAKRRGIENLFAFACLKGWKRLAKKSEMPPLNRTLDHQGFSIYANHFGLAGFRNQFNDQIISSLRHNLGWIALSSNYQLLEDYLDLYTPHFIASLCEDPSLKRRISLMLHLSYKTQSYLNNQLVEKNSLFFRDWVYYRLWSKNPADRKLLDYFHENRIAYRRYYGADPVGWGRTLGLFGSYHPPKDAARLEDLHFDANYSEVKIEEVTEVEELFANGPNPGEEDSGDASEEGSADGNNNSDSD